MADSMTLRDCTPSPTASYTSARSSHSAGIADAPTAPQHLPPCCIARGHDRRVFGDMADTSSLHGIGCKEAIHAMARGVGYGAATGVCTARDAGTSEPARVVPAVRDLILILATSRLTRFAVGRYRTSQIVRAGHIQAPGAVMRRLRLKCLSVRAAHPVWGARKIVSCLARDGRVHRRLRPCTRFCSGMALSFARLARPQGLISASRRRLRTCSGRWISKAGCGSPMACIAIP